MPEGLGYDTDKEWIPIKLIERPSHEGQAEECYYTFIALFDSEDVMMEQEGEEEIDGEMCKTFMAEVRAYPCPHCGGPLSITTNSKGNDLCSRCWEVLL